MQYKQFFFSPEYTYLLHPKTKMISLFYLPLLPSNGIKVIELARTFTRHMIQWRYQRTLVFYPNSGDLWDAVTATWIQGTYSPTDFAKTIQSTIDAVRNEWKVGIQNGLVCGPSPLMIVGGCCRTSTDTIVAIRSQLKMTKIRDVLHFI